MTRFVGRKPAMILGFAAFQLQLVILMFGNVESDGAASWAWMVRARKRKCF
jgi:hypothetical protein